MSAVALPRLRTIRRCGARAAGYAAFALALVLVARLAANPATARISVTAALAVALLGAAVYARRSAVYVLVAFLPALGLVRRVLTLVLGPTHLDPLLVVAPIAIVLLAAFAISDGAAAHRSRLANAVLVLSVLAGLASVNPLQGSIGAGVVGLLFILVPLLAFWVGRSLDDVTMRRALWLTAVAAVPAALYGLYQTFAGFPAWDVRWIEDSGYHALYVGGTIRAFGSFSSSAEYAYFLGIGVLLLVALGRRGGHAAVATLAAALVAVALVYESTRSVVFAAIGGLGLMVAARRGLPLVAAVAAAAVVGIGVSTAVGLVVPAAADPQSLIGHQVSGLANPTDSRVSTLPTHLLLIRDGITSVVAHPIGLGLGVVTIAGSKFGGSGWQTEADPSNAAVAMGLPGLLAYVAVLVLGFRRVYALAVRRRDGLSLAVLGLLTVVSLQWLNGGQYAVAYLPWLVLGWADRASGEQVEE
jgi:hypothetical protein